MFESVRSAVTSIQHNNNNLSEDLQETSEGRGAGSVNNWRGKSSTLWPHIDTPHMIHLIESSVASTSFTSFTTSQHQLFSLTSGVLQEESEEPSLGTFSFYSQDNKIIIFI